MSKRTRVLIEKIENNMAAWDELMKMPTFDAWDVAMVVFIVVASIASAVAICCLLVSH